jgi:hypothetical protein
MTKEEPLKPNWIVDIDPNIETVKIGQEIKEIPGKLTYEELEGGGVIVKLTTDSLTASRKITNEMFEKGDEDVVLILIQELYTVLNNYMNRNDDFDIRIEKIHTTI